MPRFAFDIKLNAVARISADTEEKARKLIDKHVDCVDLCCIAGGRVMLSEASLYDDDHNLFEVNGKPVE